MKFKLIAAALLLGGCYWLASQPLTQHLVLAAALLIVAWFAIRLIIAVARFALVSPATRRHYLMMMRARFTWRKMTRQMGLAVVEAATAHKPLHEWAYRWGPARLAAAGAGPALAQPKILYPKARIRADDHGLVVDLKTTPRMGRLELEKNSDHMCNYWRAHRLQIIQPRPGRVQLRALRVDPLAAGIRLGELPAAVTAAIPSAFGSKDRNEVDMRKLRLLLGRDEFGDWRYLPLAGVTGLVVAGLPGAGNRMRSTAG